MIRFSDNSKHASYPASNFRKTHWTRATICAIVGLFLVLATSQRCTTESHYDYDAIHDNASASQFARQPTSYVLHRTYDSHPHITAATSINNRKYSYDRLRLLPITQQIHLRCFKPHYDYAPNNAAEASEQRAQNGTMHFRARYYDPNTGEFISRDPLEYVDGMSLYRGYFAINGVDPLGLADSWWWWCYNKDGAKLNINDFDEVIDKLNESPITKQAVKEMNAEIWIKAFEYGYYTAECPGSVTTEITVQNKPNYAGSGIGKVPGGLADVFSGDMDVEHAAVPDLDGTSLWAIGQTTWTATADCDISVSCCDDRKVCIDCSVKYKLTDRFAAPYDVFNWGWDVLEADYGTSNSYDFCATLYLIEPIKGCNTDE